MTMILSWFQVTNERCNWVWPIIQTCDVNSLWLEYFFRDSDLKEKIWKQIENRWLWKFAYFSYWLFKFSRAIERFQDVQCTLNFHHHHYECLENGNFSFLKQLEHLLIAISAVSTPEICKFSIHFTLSLSSSLAVTEMLRHSPQRLKTFSFFATITMKNLRRRLHRKYFENFIPILGSLSF